MKKFSAIVLVLVLAMGILAGCGNMMGDESNKNQGSNQSGNEQTKPSTQATTPTTQATTPTTTATEPTTEATEPSSSNTITEDSGIIETTPGNEEGRMRPMPGM